MLDKPIITSVVIVVIIMQKLLHGATFLHQYATHNDFSIP